LLSKTVLGFQKPSSFRNR